MTAGRIAMLAIVVTIGIDVDDAVVEVESRPGVRGSRRGTVPA